MADSDEDRINQDEIEALLRATQKSSPSDSGAEPNPAAEPKPAATPSPTLQASPAAPEDAVPASGSDDIEFLLNQAEQALASADAPTEETLAGLSPFELHDFKGTPPSTERATLELLRDVELDLRIELGRTEMYLEEVLKLRKGAVVPLDKLAGDPVDIFVNGRLIARGEVLVFNDNFCVRVAELISGDLTQNE